MEAAIETQTFTDRLITKTPWWAISMGLHATLALVLAFVVVLGGAPEDDEAVVVSPARKPRPIPDIDPPQRDQNPTDKLLDIPKPSDETVFRKAEEGPTDKPDDIPMDKPKGDDPNYVSDQPFKGPSTNGVIGVKGGGGGAFGYRIGGGQNDRCRIGGGDPKTQGAVLEALKWLARHQSPEGSWGVQGHADRCGRIEKYAGKCVPNLGRGDFDAGVTGLALLAFLGSGYSHLSKNTYDGICFGDVVRKGLQWVMARQDTEGCIGSREASQYMYNHLICSLAVCEAYGLTGSFLYQEPAKRAVEFTVASQNPDRGWRYSYRSGDNDSSVTGWAAMVLKSAEISGVSFPKTAYDGVRNWFDEVTEAEYYRVGYTHRGTGLVYNESNRDFRHHEALTAIGMMSRIFIDRNRSDPRLAGGAQILVRDLPKWDGLDIDFYYWYYASLALFQYDGPSGPMWSQWNKAMKDALVKNQNVNAGCKTGSWEPVDRWSCEGGRVYGTAINALTLEVYYRYANVFGTR